MHLYDLVFQLLQQEGQSDMGFEVYSVDGMDAEPRQTGRGAMAIGVLGWIAHAHHRACHSRGREVDKKTSDQQMHGRRTAASDL